VSRRLAMDGLAVGYSAFSLVKVVQASAFLPSSARDMPSFSRLSGLLLPLG